MKLPDAPSSDAPDHRSALDWARQAGQADAVMAELKVLAHRRQRRRALLGATLACGLATGVWFFAPNRPSDQPLTAGPTILVVTPAQQTLPDGTAVDLREGAVLHHEFQPAMRRVVLERGTAHFQVTKDATRPFVVEADGIQVRAVGTAFSVQVGAAGVEVLVTEGRVSLNAAANRSAEGPLLVAGEGAAVRPVAGEPEEGRGLLIRPLSAVEVATGLDWRIPRLEFAGTPLTEAVAMMNRHNRRQLVLADAALGDLQISGMLRADNLTALRELLRTNFGIGSEERGEDEILLRRGP
jgi:transmembrane sensor